MEGLSNILNVNEYALDNPAISTNYGTIFNLFEYYFIYGLHPVKIDGKVYLVVDKNLSTDALTESLSDWCGEYEVFQKGILQKLNLLI